MKQVQVFGGGGKPEDEEEAIGGQVQEQVAAIDDLLDEIDTVMATDAQSFVRGFVQKGGQ